VKNHRAMDLSRCPLFVALQGLAQKQRGRRGSAAGQKVVEMSRRIAQDSDVQKGRTTAHVPIDMIDDCPAQPPARSEASSLTILSSIERFGVLQPVHVSTKNVRRGRYELGDGHGRKYASIKYGLPTLECIVHADMTSTELWRECNKRRKLKGEHWLTHYAMLEREERPQALKEMPSGTASMIRGFYKIFGIKRADELGLLGWVPPRPTVVEAIHHWLETKGRPSSKLNRRQIGEWVFASRKRVQQASDCAKPDNATQATIRKLQTAIQKNRDFPRSEWPR
jgi:hypothetical protein